jgi:hypothetical protein
MNAAIAAAVHASSPWFPGSQDDITKFVEHILEAAAGRVFYELEAARAAAARGDAVALLERHLCGECVELLTPEPERPTIGDPDIPGSAELEERTTFLGWSGRVEELGDQEQDLCGEEVTPRMALIFELHTNAADRHPLGIAQDIAHAIDAIHVHEDADAIAILDDLAAAEEVAAKREKGAACLAALRVLVDPDLEDSRALDLIADWTLEELAQVLEWAEVEFKAQALAAVSGPDVARTIAPTPEVVAQLKRRMK